MLRVGIGGWTFAPWRGPFFPKGLKHADELRYAGERLGAIEINGTFYRTQSPQSFRKWAEETPDGFVFSLKGHRSVVNRGRLAEAEPAVTRFVESGLSELGDKLGPILWQLPPTKRFDEGDLDAFLSLLPGEIDGRPLRHALEVRHESFRNPVFIALLRRHKVPVVYAHAERYPAIADATGDFVYARLQQCQAEEPAGYPAAELDAWADRSRQWEQGRTPPDLPSVGPSGEPVRPRECFVFFIAGAKERAPAAAMALIERLAAGR